MITEVWKDIKGYEGLFQISNQGNIKKNGKKIVPWKDNKGYLRVYLSYKKEPNVKVHRLVANAFIPNPDNKPQIDHINTIKTDNRVENLRWVTNQENARNPNTLIKYKGKRSLSNNNHAKKVINIDTGEVFNSAIEASLSVSNYKYGVIEAIYRKRTYHKYRWKYL